MFVVWTPSLTQPTHMEFGVPRIIIWTMVGRQSIDRLKLWELDEEWVVFHGNSARRFPLSEDDPPVDQGLWWCSHECVDTRTTPSAARRWTVPGNSSTTLTIIGFHYGIGVLVLHHHLWMLCPGHQSYSTVQSMVDLDDEDEDVVFGVIFKGNEFSNLLPIMTVMIMI